MNYFNNMYNPQMNMNRIDKQIEELQNMKAQMQQPMIQQNFVQQSFQSDFDAKWIDNKNEINNITVNRDAIFMDKNNPIFYLKDKEGNIKAYDFTEHIEIDEKDLKIKELEEKIANLERKVQENGKSVIQSKSKQSNDNDKQV